MDLSKKSFEMSYVSDKTGQEFILDLTVRKRYIPELKFVLEENRKIIGHIMYTNNYIMNNDKNSIFKGSLLDPISIA